ncbi:hypothetical protein [Micromonospora arborensis]|uniref:hypothetical protein n=1 Tax=Micromonospora arborensis TaxID=2116518 RepID=UPI003CC59801
MVMVRASAVRWASDDFPGWIEVSVHDARGQDHRIVEKASVLSPQNITADAAFPIELWIEAAADDIAGDEVVVTLSHEVETMGGRRSLVLSSADVLPS